MNNPGLPLPDASMTFEREVLGPKGNVLGVATVVFEGTVRKCEPWNAETTCPACGKAKAPWRPWRLGRTPKTKSVDEEFVARTCRYCGLEWRERHTDETRRYLS